MPIDLRYDPAKDVLYATMSGEPSLEAFAEAIETITHSDEYPPDVRTLWDMRELDFSKVDRSLEEQLILIRRRFPERANAKLAFVVANKLGLGMTRMYEILSDDPPQTSSVFNDFEKARQWLLEGIPGESRS